jgi:hypothetical protein
MSRKTGADGSGARCALRGNNCDIVDMTVKVNPRSHSTSVNAPCATSKRVTNQQRPEKQRHSADHNGHVVDQIRKGLGLENWVCAFYSEVGFKLPKSGIVGFEPRDDLITMSRVQI